MLYNYRRIGDYIYEEKDIKNKYNSNRNNKYTK